LPNHNPKKNVFSKNATTSILEDCLSIKPDKSKLNMQIIKMVTAKLSLHLNYNVFAPTQ
jgi:hypothetical protein